MTNSPGSSAAQNVCTTSVTIRLLNFTINTSHDQVLRPPRELKDPALACLATSPSTYGARDRPQSNGRHAGFDDPTSDCLETVATSTCQHRSKIGVLKIERRQARPRSIFKTPVFKRQRHTMCCAKPGTAPRLSEWKSPAAAAAEDRHSPRVHRRAGRRANP